jgi:signal transduction histidine kinase
MPMGGTLRDRLFPNLEAKDDKFRQDLRKASTTGLRLLSAHAIAVPLLLGAAQFRLIPGADSPALLVAPSAAIVALGVFALAVSRVRRFERHSRLFAAALAFLIGMVLISFTRFGSSEAANGDRHLPGYLCLLMLVTVVAVPLRPLQALALGLGLEAGYAACALLVRGADQGGHLFFFVLAILSAALAAVVYAHHVGGYHTREKALRVNEYLCLAQSRVLLSENAASLGRLAATLVHELNSPLGTLASAVDTMAVISAKQASAPLADRARLLTLQADLRKSIRASLERLQQTVSRIEHLTALDEDEFHSVDVNELLKDVAALVETRSKNSVRIAFDLHPLPELTCRPQQLSAVFSNVLGNAAEAMKGCGTVLVATERKESRIEIRVQDSGCGISEDDLNQIFEPGFKIAEGRMSTGNWSLFSCRQIVHGHGGEIYMTSAEGKGSTVVIALPF